MPKRTLIDSLWYAARGLAYAFKTQRNMRLHVGIGVVVLAAAAGLGVSAIEWVIVCVTVTLVLVAELLNTAVEVLVDLSSKERRHEAMIIKDVAAGAVLACCVSAVIVGCVVLLPWLVQWLLRAFS